MKLVPNTLVLCYTGTEPVEVDPELDIHFFPASHQGTTLLFPLFGVITLILAGSTPNLQQVAYFDSIMDDEPKYIALHGNRVIDPIKEGFEDEVNELLDTQPIEF